MNNSKKNDPRFWQLWKGAGSVGTIKTAFTTTREKDAAKKQFVASCRLLGNLTGPEIRELRTYEFDAGAQTVNQQIRRYYLKVKNGNPGRASEMISEVGEIADDGNLTQEDVRSLCRTLQKYVNGFLIYFQGKEYPDYDIGYYPSVTITQLELLYGSPSPKVMLGATNDKERQIEDGLNNLLQRVSELSTKIFLLEWEGNKIPRGTRINGKPIGWTQHGMVTSDQGQTIGTYERLSEFGGESGREQKMVVFVD